MYWNAAVTYALVLLTAAAAPFVYSRGNFAAVLGGAVAFLAAGVGGFFALHFVAYVGDFYSFNSFLIQALSEEIPRGILLYLIVLRGENSLAERAVFGATFGWLEFLLRMYGVDGGEACAELVRPLSCASGLPYLGIAWSEPIIFHIFISAVNYRDANTIPRLVLAIICGAIVHAANNTVKFLPVWEDSNFLIYFVMPTLLILSYIIIFFCVYPKVYRKNLK